MTAKKILNQIIKKGGLLGNVALSFRQDKEKTSRYLKECYQMTHTKLAKELWGDELTQSIIDYFNDSGHKNKRVDKFDRQVIKAIKDSRISKRIKQDCIASALEMTQSNYCKLEKGLIPPTVGQVERIATALNISIFDILDLAKNQKYAQSE